MSFCFAQDQSVGLCLFTHGFKNLAAGKPALLQVHAYIGKTWGLMLTCKFGQAHIFTGRTGLSETTMKRCTVQSNW